MTNDMGDFGGGGDLSDAGQDSMDLTRIEAEGPHHLEILPDGREAIEFGDGQGAAEFNHRQGDNELDFQGTCGLVSCEDVLRQFGVDVTEDDIVKFAADQNLCTKEGAPEMCGGTTPFDQVKILDAHDVPAHVELCDSLENLAGRVEDGHGVIVGVNAGVLWDQAAYYDTGGPNHAIVVTAVDRDPQSGEILGFKINDSGVPQSNRFVDADTMNLAWTGGNGAGLMVATDGVLDPGPQAAALS